MKSLIQKEIQEIKNPEMKICVSQIYELMKKLDKDEKEKLSQVMTLISTASNSSDDSLEQASEEPSVWSRIEESISNKKYDDATELYEKIIEGKVNFLPNNSHLVKAYLGLSQISDLQQKANFNDAFLSEHFSSQSVKYKNLALRQYEYINENYISIIEKCDSDDEKINTIKAKMQNAVKEMKKILNEDSTMIGADCITGYEEYVSGFENTELSGASELCTE